MGCREVFDANIYNCIMCYWYKKNRSSITRRKIDDDNVTEIISDVASSPKDDQVHLYVSFINDIIKIIDAYPPAISLKKPGEGTNMFNWEKK